jgi:hypothetical protein
MKTQKRALAFLLFTGLLVAGCFLVSSAAPAVDTPSGSSEEVNQLLSQVKTEAIALERDCEEIAGWAGDEQSSWESHAGKLNLIVEHTHRAGRLLTKLHQARATASPWHQQAIDRVSFLLEEIDNVAAAMIHRFSADTAHVHSAVYQDYANVGSKLAKELGSLISDYVGYGDKEADFHRLQENLDSTAR